MFFRKRREDELDAELRAHIAMAARDRVERGRLPATPSAARAGSSATWRW